MVVIPSTPRAKRSIWAQEKLRRLDWSRLRADKRQLDLRGYVTTTADAENKFLEDMPGEIKEVLKWLRRCKIQRPSRPQYGGLFRAVLGSHVRGWCGSSHKPFSLCSRATRPSPNATSDQSSKHCAWLNLGFALRRVVLYRTQDPWTFREGSEARCSKSGLADPHGRPFTSPGWSQATRSSSIACLRGCFRLPGGSPVLRVRI
jgi:hypothetical protein